MRDPWRFPSSTRSERQDLMGKCMTCHGTGRGMAGGPCMSCRGTGRVGQLTEAFQAFIVLAVVACGIILFIQMQ
jgi:DnaJ-class molecular chaperone